MGQAAKRIDDPMGFGGEAFASFEAEIVPIRPSLAVPAAAEAPRGAGELTTIMSMMSRVGQALTAERQRSDALERRLAENERLLLAAQRKSVELEARVATASDQAKGEKTRNLDLQRRSDEMISRTREMMAQAGERIRAAESRAEKAEAALATVQGALERQIAPLLA